MQFLLNLSPCVKSYGYLCQIYQNHSPNMVMSGHPSFKFRNFYFSPNSVLNFRKSYRIWGKLAQQQKRYRQKTNWDGNTPPPLLIGLKPLSYSYFGIYRHYTPVAWLLCCNNIKYWSMFPLFLFFKFRP